MSSLEAQLRAAAGDESHCQLPSGAWSVTVKNTFITVEGPDLVNITRRTKRAKTEPVAACKAVEEPCNEVRRSDSDGPDEDAIAALLAKLARGEMDIVEAVHGSVRRLAFLSDGCRIVQQALDVASPSMQASMAEELRGAVKAAARSLQANFVLQRMIRLLPATSVAFMSRELASSAVQTACHFTGCRVLCRLFEHGNTADADIAFLMGEVLTSDIPKLCRHRFGCHVLVAILEHGQGLHRQQIADAFRGEAVSQAKHRHASLVLEVLLMNCQPAEHEALCKELMQCPPQVASLASHSNGRRVMTAIAKTARLSTTAQSIRTSQ